MDIDDIFKKVESKKKELKITSENDKKIQKLKEKKQNELNKKNRKKKIKKKDKKKKEINRIDGLRIYTRADLKLGNTGGDTPDCPFDCQCCF